MIFPSRLSKRERNCAKPQSKTHNFPKLAFQVGADLRKANALNRFTKKAAEFRTDYFHFYFSPYFSPKGRMERNLAVIPIPSIKRFHFFRNCNFHLLSNPFPVPLNCNFFAKRCALNGPALYYCI